MEKLLVFDEKDYTPDMDQYEKFSVRGIIVRDGRIATELGTAGDYKLLGGGIDPGESLEEALTREVLEEGGLFVIPDSLEEIGEVEEIRRDCFKPELIFHNHAYIYRCQVKEETTEPQMTESEKAKGYHLAWATPEEILAASKNHQDKKWILRDAKIVEKLFLSK